MRLTLPIDAKTEPASVIWLDLQPVARAEKHREPPYLTFPHVVALLVHRLTIPVFVELRTLHPSLSLPKESLGENMVDAALLVGIYALVAAAMVHAAETPIPAK